MQPELVRCDWNSNEQAEFTIECEDDEGETRTCARHLSIALKAHLSVCSLDDVLVSMVKHPRRHNTQPPVQRRCSVCGGEGEHDWEVHSAELRASSYE